MSTSRGFQTYQNVSILTAPPERLMLMLYEGEITSINTAKQAIQEDNAELRRSALRKARDINTELMTALNFDIGGELAINLHGLYQFVNGRLIQADMSNTVEPLDEALRILTVLNDAWIQAVDLYQQQQSDTSYSHQMTAAAR